MIVKDNDNVEYLLDGDTMREMTNEDSSYYAFNKTEDTIHCPANEWYIRCHSYSIDGEDEPCQEFNFEIKAGVLTPRLMIGCRRFVNDNLAILANWLGSSNPELKAYIDRRLKEIQEYYDRRDKSCEETSTTPPRY